MHLFIRILQKVVGTETVVDVYQELTSSNIPNIWMNYYAYESNTDKDNRVYWVYQYIHSLYYNLHDRERRGCVIYDQLYSAYILKNKYEKLKIILDNPFIDRKTKTEFMINISKTQRAYRGFSKLGYLYKYQKSKTQITTNMMYDEIEPGSVGTIELYHEGSRYLFTKYDLTRIINVSLTNSPYYFSEPLTIRNPYNNVPFSKSILYTIYFRMIENPLKFPVLFHNFVWLDFDLELFRAENECLIREQYFREYIYNATSITINNEIRSMLRMHHRSNIYVEKEFPTKELIRIFRPYYYLYLVSQYHICGLEKRLMTNDYLIEKLNDLHKHNPLFGRKTYIKNNSGFGNQKAFNMDAPVFTMNHAYKYHNFKKNMVIDEDETDSEYADDDYSVS